MNKFLTCRTFGEDESAHSYHAMCFRVRRGSAAFLFLAECEGEEKKQIKFQNMSTFGI